jgi:protoheme IX farnesyltransferase
VRDINPSQATVLRRLTLAAVALTYLLIIAGHAARVSNDGPGCPDWPLCFGAVLPLENSKLLAELTHRALAVLVGPVVIVLAALCLRWSVGRQLRRLGVSAAGILLAQVALGALIVFSQWQATLVALHLLAGLATLGVLTAMAIDVRVLRAESPAPHVANRATLSLRRSINLLAGAIFVLLVTGALVAGNGAALACGQTFPVCNGGLLPNGGRLVLLQWLHRAATFTVALLLLSVVLRMQRNGSQMDRSIKLAALALVVGFVALGVQGWLMVALNRPASLAALHHALSAAVWMAVVTLALLTERRPLFIPERAPHPVPAWRRTLSDYVALTKPRVISLLLFTTLAAMFITSAGAPPWYLVAWTLVGGFLMAGGANAVNMAYDADIDYVMGRTSKRPTASGRISPRRAFAFGLTLATLSFMIFLLFVNWLAAGLAVLGFVYYTVIYTRWLKRSTWQNIVIGGGAGAIPPLIGWAAASGQLSVAAIFLFVIVFYWTPPHFWALALMKRKDYAAAGVPMLPVVAGVGETAHQILIYSVGMVALTLVLVPLQAMGSVYLAGAVLLGGLFVWRAWQLNRERTPETVWGLYRYSLLYLFGLFVAMMLDRALQWI